MFENKFNTKKTDPLVEAVKLAQRDGDIRRQAEAVVNEHFGVYSRNAVIRENLAAYDAAIEEAYKCMKEGDPTKLPNISVPGKSGEMSVGDDSISKKSLSTSDQRTQEKSHQQIKKDFYDPQDNPTRNKRIGTDPDGGARYAVEGKMADKDYDKDGKIESPKDEVWGSRLRAAKMAGKLKEAVKKEYDDKDQSEHGVYKGKKKQGYVVSDKKTGTHTAYHNPQGDDDYGEVDDFPSKRKAVKQIKKSYNLNKEETDYSAQDRAPVTKSAPKEDPSTPKSYPGAASSAPTAQRLSNAKAALKEDGVTAPKDFSQKRFANKGAVVKAPVPGVSIAEEEKDVATWPKRTVHKTKPGVHMSSTRVLPKDRAAYEKDVFEKGAAAHKALSRKKMEEAELDEAAYSAKAARAGKDIGKPGKMFSSIAKKAGERYGSEERGKKVAGAILKRIRAKHMKEDSSFNAAQETGKTVSEAGSDPSAWAGSTFGRFSPSMSGPKAQLTQRQQAGTGMKDVMARLKTAPAKPSYASQQPAPAATPAPEAPKATAAKPATASQTFAQAYAAARKAGGSKAQFTWQGKQYQAAASKKEYVPMSQQKKVDSIPAVTKPTEAPKSTPTPSLPSMAGGQSKMTMPSDIAGRNQEQDKATADVSARGIRGRSPSTGTVDTSKFPAPGSAGSATGRATGVPNTPAASQNPDQERTKAPAPAPTYSPGTPAAKAWDNRGKFGAQQVAESVQVGDNKYRIV